MGVRHNVCLHAYIQVLLPAAATQAVTSTLTGASISASTQAASSAQQAQSAATQAQLAAQRAEQVGDLPACCQSFPRLSPRVPLDDVALCLVSHTGTRTRSATHGDSRSPLPPPPLARRLLPPWLPLQSASPWWCRRPLWCRPRPSSSLLQPPSPLSLRWSPRLHRWHFHPPSQSPGPTFGSGHLGTLARDWAGGCCGRQGVPRWRLDVAALPEVGGG